MGLQNVEKIETQQNHEKSWFNRFKYKLGAATGATTALVVSTSSNAFLKSADVTTATTAAGGEEVLSSTGIWVLTIVVGMAIFGLVIAAIKKK
ncbi:hypothetical protein [Acinetobacter sp. NS-4]|uniref:hypothetical protein n=1 Tax=Acinetobacter sp. NS-4 TaxID=3127956 RepID=UPI00307E05C2